MNPATDLIKSFFEKIKSLNFFQRLFYWKKVHQHLADSAYALNNLVNELQSLENNRSDLKSQLLSHGKDLEILSGQKIKWEEEQKRYSEILIEKNSNISALTNRLTTSDTNCHNFEKHVQTLLNEASATKENIKHLQQILAEKTGECIKLKSDAESKNKEQSRALATLDKISEQVQRERENEKQQIYNREIQRLKSLKETWVNHQAIVSSCIKNICNKHTIEYIDKVPFTGEPDNTIKICNEYIVFDAKSPGGEDASSFFTYLKLQAEKAIKYAKQQNVKPEIFFVVPSNTSEHIKQSSFHLGDYNVFIISTDSIEPIILALKKIESYEFAEQLTPEERENICRILGKFAHLAKRRIQVDSFFAKKFMEIVYKCESSLPEDVLEEIASFERSEKLNPPIEKRVKTINNKQLQLEIDQLETDAVNKGIVMEDLSNALNNVPLYM